MHNPSLLLSHNPQLFNLFHNLGLNVERSVCLLATILFLSHKSFCIPFLIVLDALQLLRHYKHLLLTSKRNTKQFLFCYYGTFWSHPLWFVKHLGILIVPFIFLNQKVDHLSHHVQSCTLTNINLLDHNFCSLLGSHYGILQETFLLRV